jgi:hypothetical protein
LAVKQQTRSGDIIGREMQGRRSMEQACADLRADYEKRPTPQLARMIEQLQAEIAIRKGRRTMRATPRTSSTEQREKLAVKWFDR